MNTMNAVVLRRARGLLGGRQPKSIIKVWIAERLERKAS
jgi:hypothetical protein